MYANYLWDSDSESSSDTENITPYYFQNHRKILSGATYCKKLVVENGQSLHPVNWNMAYFSQNSRSIMIIIVWNGEISKKKFHFHDF